MMEIWQLETLEWRKHKN